MAARRAGGAQQDLADDLAAGAAGIVAVPDAALLAVRIIHARLPLEAVGRRPERVLPIAGLDDAANRAGVRGNDLSTQVTSEHSLEPSTTGSRFGSAPWSVG